MSETYEYKLDQMRGAIKSGMEFVDKQKMVLTFRLKWLVKIKIKPTDKEGMYIINGVPSKFHMDYDYMYFDQGCKVYCPFTDVKSVKLTRSKK